MQPIYGLIIKKEWLDKILSSNKVWELRSSNTYHRGLVLLIESGSGSIKGYTHIVDSIRLDQETYEQNLSKHQVQLAYNDCRWNRYAWVLSGTNLLSEPYNYQHPKGAVIWVEITPDIVPQYAKLLNELRIRGEDCA